MTPTTTSRSDIPFEFMEDVEPQVHRRALDGRLGHLQLPLRHGGTRHLQLPLRHGGRLQHLQLPLRHGGHLQHLQLPLRLVMMRIGRCPACVMTSDSLELLHPVLEQ